MYVNTVSVEIQAGLFMIGIIVKTIIVYSSRLVIDKHDTGSLFKLSYVDGNTARC